MHPRIIAQRQARAQQRTLEAIAQIASVTNLPAPDLASIREKSPDVQRVKEWEALAVWLEMLAQTQLPDTKPKSKAKKETDHAN